MVIHRSGLNEAYDLIKSLGETFQSDDATNLFDWVIGSDALSLDLLPGFVGELM